MIQGTGCVLSVMLIAEHVFKQLIIANNAKELIEGATPQHALVKAVIMMATQSIV